MHKLANVICIILLVGFWQPCFSADKSPDSGYYTITYPDAFGQTHKAIIPKEIPDPFANDFTGRKYSIPFGAYTLIAILPKEGDSSYALVFRKNHKIIAAYAKHILSDRKKVKLYWIYIEIMPVKCTGEEQQAFLTVEARE